MPKAALHAAQQDRLNAEEGPHQDRRKPSFDRFGNGLPETRRCICKFFLRNPQSEGTGRSASAYRVAPRYVVHTALAKVWDVFRAQAFSTSATIDGTLIFGCVWPLAAAT